MAKEKALTNPHGANQWVADPRQQLFLAYWKDPKSPTFSDVKNSAIRAGFAPEYADNLTSLLPEWLLVAMGQTNPLLLKAEKNLAEFLELPNETQAMGMYGPVFETVEKKVKVGTFKNGKPKYKKVKEKRPVMTLNSKIMKIKQDTSHFIAETVGKKKYRKSGNEGGSVFNVFVFENEQRARIAKRIVGGGSVGDPDGEGAIN